MPISEGGTYSEVEEQQELARWFVRYVLETRKEFEPDVLRRKASSGYVSVAYGEGDWLHFRDGTSMNVRMLVFYRPKEEGVKENILILENIYRNYRKDGPSQRPKLATERQLKKIAKHAHLSLSKRVDLGMVVGLLPELTKEEAA